MKKSKTFNKIIIKKGNNNISDELVYLYDLNNYSYMSERLDSCCMPAPHPPPPPGQCIGINV